METMGVSAILVLLCFPSLLNAASERHVAYMENELIKYLFRNCSRNAAPQKNISDVVEMNVTFNLRNILSLDETSEILTSSAWLGISWHDFRLSWNERSYEGINTLYVTRSKAWIPDLTVDNTASQYKFLGQPDDILKITSDGLVGWYPGDVFKTRCSMDVTYFPFDEQNCKMEIISWIYGTNTMRIGSVDSRQSTVTEEHGEWNVTGLKVRRNYDNNTYTSATVSIHICRRNTFHILNIVLPIITVTFINAFVFILPAESGEKIKLATTLFLSYAVFLSCITDNMPSTSTTKSVLGVFVATQLTVSALSILCSVAILKQYHKQKNENKDLETGEAQAKLKWFCGKVNLVFFVVFFVLGVSAIGTLVTMLKVKFF